MQLLRLLISWTPLLPSQGEKKGSLQKIAGESTEQLLELSHKQRRLCKVQRAKIRVFLLRGRTVDQTPSAQRSCISGLWGVSGCPESPASSVRLSTGRVRVLLDRGMVVKSSSWWVASLPFFKQRTNNYTTRFWIWTSSSTRCFQLRVPRRLQPVIQQWFGCHGARGELYSGLKTRFKAQKLSLCSYSAQRICIHISWSCFVLILQLSLKQ